MFAAPLAASWRRSLACAGRHPALAFGYRLLQQPVIAGSLFVGLIAYWLWPSVHGHTMHSNGAYWAMNLSMIVDGLLFWWPILDPRPPEATPTTHAIATRIRLLWAVMSGRIIIAAPIALAGHDLYAPNPLGGRGLGIDPLTDQQWAGLITWIPAATMSVIDPLILLAFGFRHSGARPAGEPRAAHPE